MNYRETVGWTFDELGVLLAGVEYKPGWTFAIKDQYDVAGSRRYQLIIEATVQDVENPNDHCGIIHEDTFDSHAIQSGKHFFEFVNTSIEAIERHEQAEWYRVNGRRWQEPHP